MEEGKRMKPDWENFFTIFFNVLKSVNKNPLHLLANTNLCTFVFGVGEDY